MTEQTEHTIIAVIAGDRTIPQGVGEKVLALLHGKGESGAAADVVKTRAEAAQMLRVCPVTVTNWGKRGIIQAVKIGGRRKAIGYTLSSINAVINGSASVEVSR